MSFDGAIIVAGAGAAGMATAISASRAGEKVVLVEKSATCGGTMVNSLIHTIGGLYDCEGHYINEGLPVELATRLLSADPNTRQRKIGRTWTLSVDPDVYHKVTNTWLANEGNIHLLTGSVLTRLSVENGRIYSLQISGLSGQVKVDDPLALVDTTGCADVVRIIDENLVMGNDAPPLAALIFQLINIPPGVMEFPGNITLLRKIRRAAAEGELPGQCLHAWIDMGVSDNDAYVKLPVRLDRNWRDPSVKSELMHNAIITRDALLAYIKDLPGFEAAVLGKTGRLGIRDGGRFRGAYQLTVDDVRSLKKFDDGACRCCWPIEYWDSSTGVELEYLEAGGYYEIPLRSLSVDGYVNLWGAGKCLSADVLAQASARVIGSCWAMGQAVGCAVVNR